MAAVEFKQLGHPEVLREIGRVLLQRFFDPFEAELKAKNLSLPVAATCDDEFFHSVAWLIKSPDLPPRLIDALFAIEEIARPEAQERLQTAVLQNGGLIMGAAPDCSEALALQVWLASPNALATAPVTQGLLGMLSFEGFTGPVHGSRHGEMRIPTEASLHDLTVSLDGWFVHSHRGAHTTRIGLHAGLAGEYWFVIRHGGVSRWVYNVEEEKSGLIHLRPQDEDLILCLSAEDELWINAGIKADREIYREHLGLLLRGARDYFSERCLLTLEPLRADAADALDATGVEGVRDITLRHEEVDWGDGGHHVTTNTSDDIFHAINAPHNHNWFIPKIGTISRAGFLVRFAGSDRQRPAEVCPPYALNVARPSDASPILRFLAKRGFRRPFPPPANSSKAA